ncbi:MAG: T9SS type A sorting domain-containing protein [Cytophagales bacterium]|nr:T9SS type A sorting domain-containing protein [Cytophagales bacterium]
MPTRIFKASQIAEKGVFSTEKVKAKKELNVDLTQVLRDDEKEKGSGMPYRFGKAVDVNYNLANSGEWHDMEGARIWKLQITSKKALSLNLIFKKLFIPGNGELYIYNEERTVIYGPVTSRDMTPSGKFSSDLIYGQSIILELLEPKASKNKSVLEVSKVIHGYKLAFFGDAQSCNNAINCSTEGSNWQDESDGVAMILLADYTRICSGSLLNHGCQDYTPNILSAFHCADISTNMTDPCSEGDFSKDVQAGPFRTSQITVLGTAGVCRGTEYVYTAKVTLGHQPGYTYSWNYPSNWMFVSQNDNTIRLLTPSSSQPTGGPLEVNVNNGCGSSGFTGFTAYLLPCRRFSALTSPGVELFNQYPNPSTGTLTVEQTGQARDVGPYSIELYNNYGERVTTISTSNRQVHLDTGSLPGGHYILKIIYRDGILTRRIVVERE